MRKVFLILFLLVGISYADSTVVDVFHFFRIDGGAVTPGRVVYDSTGLNSEMLRLKLKGVDSDSIHIKWTQYVFWVPQDCTVIYNPEYDNMLWNVDTLGNAWMEDTLWRTVYDGIEIITLPSL